MTTELILSPSDSTQPLEQGSNIVQLLPEHEGYRNFYAMLRQSTLRVITIAEALLHDDPEIPDPEINPQGHRNKAMEKYGIYGPIPTMPVDMGHYHLARLHLIAISSPDSYSPGFKPPALKHFLGLHDPINTLLHCTEILIEQADNHEPLRLVFTDFPAQNLSQIYISSKPHEDRFILHALGEAQMKIYNFTQKHLVNVLSWQANLGGPVIDGSLLLHFVPEVNK